MKYPVSMRALHWTMAIIILGLIWAGWTMVSMNDEDLAKYGDFYPWHKSFGMLALFLVMARLFIRTRARLPPLPAGLSAWEGKAARFGHFALYTLMIVVPCMGYAMSSSFTQSDGVYFFGVNLPELLPKNDARFEVFQTLHRWLAYTLLALVALHLLGALKHRFLDRNRDNDVLSRMI
ncbi:MAG: cytochrome b [Pseudomonadota bacterium]|nr:cytochrome b [Pseudomonadota bacterium]